MSNTIFVSYLYGIWVSLVSTMNRSDRPLTLYLLLKIFLPNFYFHQGCTCPRKEYKTRKASTSKPIWRLYIFSTATLLSPPIHSTLTPAPSHGPSSPWVCSMACTSTWLQRHELWPQLWQKSWKVKNGISFSCKFFYSCQI